MKAKRSRTKSVILATALVLGTSGVGAGGWALNRFVIDHVEISDVRAYEAAASAAATTPASSSASASPSSSASASATATASVSATATPTTSASASATPTATTKPTTKASSSASAPVVTATSYTSESVKLVISKVVTGSGNSQVTYYVADVTVTDATKLRSAFANNEFGTNIIDLPSSIAKQNGAIFAINGDYYGFRDSGIVIRNGVVYRDAGTRMGLAFYRNGTVKVYDETKTSAQALVDAGVWNTMSFGPALLVNGEIPAGIEDFEVDTNFGNHSIQGSQPRTAVGVISSNHYVFVAVDGRSPGYSKGVTMTEMAKIMQGLGCKTAYNIDGGGSTTMYFNGALINRPSNGGERGTSDIFYIAG